ncbi:MAG: hypothetical protein HY646_13740 [Acidobacteria bacterium]|nr:hypothetical protein [Acidobacteriota bacterium]
MLHKCLYCPKRFCDDEAGLLAYERHTWSHATPHAQPKPKPMPIVRDVSVVVPFVDFEARRVAKVGA